MENELCLQPVEDAELLRVEGGTTVEQVCYEIISNLIKLYNYEAQQLVRQLR
jgi:hypothetical protein